LYLGPTRLKLAALILNLAVVAYMAYSIRGEPPSGAPRP
jgi:uncharacterized membrane protein (DUF2068 family)